MTTLAKPKHKEARGIYLAHLDLHPGRVVNNDLDPLEAGIVGDPDHDGGYHVSRQDNDADDYSVDESVRDRRGRSDTASAMDIGYFKRVTPRGTFDLYDYNRWLIGLCKAGDRDTADLREVIYSLDGETVRRWDRLGRRTTGDSSHRTHTHLSEFRDADGHRMVNLAQRWIQHLGLLAGEDDDMTPAEFLAILDSPGVAARMKALAVGYTGGGIPAGMSVLGVLNDTLLGVREAKEREEALATEVTALQGTVADLTGLVASLGETVADLAAAQGSATDLITSKVSGVENAVSEVADLITTGGGNPDTAAILTGVDARVTAAVEQINAQTKDSVADLGEGGSAQVRADQD